MSHSDCAIAQQMLSSAQFEQLCDLIQHTADSIAPNVWLWQSTHARLAQAISDHPGHPGHPGTDEPYTHLILLVSMGFSVLVRGYVDHTNGHARYKTELTLAPDAIAHAFQRLFSHLPASAFQAHSPDTVRAWLEAPAHGALHATFALRLFQALSAAPSQDVPPQPLQRPPETPAAIADSAYPLACRPVEQALHQQTEQERLLNQVISQIHQSLELPVILQTAVEQVRQFLQVDRLLIYQLLPETPATDWTPAQNPASPASLPPLSHSVTYESCASDTIPSALGLAEEACFENNPHLRDKYNRGFALRLEDIDRAYPATSCLGERLRQLQVRAKLVVPIRVRNRLWGLLIAHQCRNEREWQDREERFLRHIAEHLAIAINQAQLYTRLQRQKELLEQRVIERTQHLKDALLAAQAANRAKTEFLAAMSHELRTPLTSIIGLSSTLIHWNTHELTPRQKQHLDTIHTSGRHLLELINDILDLSQVEAGKVALRLSNFSLSKLAKQSLKIIQDDALQQQIELKLSLNIDPERDRFTGDPQRIRQILLNLLSNAIKFTPPGGIVTLRVSATEAMAVFQVEDTGIGIAQEDKPLLFEMFQQLEPSYSRQYGGAGVGLALTKQLVELHGGAIDVKSEVGVGSVFTVRLPAHAHGLHAATDRQAANLLAQPSGRILLIENREETATMICDMLNAAGYQLIWMTEGAIALDQIALMEPVALILSLQVSDTNSYDLIRQLRQTPSGKQIKVLAISRAFDAEEQQRCLSLGADGYISEPFNPSQLAACVNTMLGTA